MADMVPPLQLCHVTMCIDPLALLDEEGRQQTTLPVAGHLRHEGLGGAAGGSPQCGQDLPETGVDHVLLFEDGKKIRTSLVNLQEEGHKIALEGHRLRPGRSRGIVRRGGR